LTTLKVNKVKQKILDDLDKIYEDNINIEELGKLKL
jgi:hypothetical protein